MPSATTVMPSASLSDSIAFRIPWLRGRLWISVMKERSILISSAVMSALADITADEIKIDRSFITDIHKRPRSQGILRAIESLSEALGMTVVAEGIETFEELTYLQAATRIRYAQGYYFSRPIFLEDLAPATRTASETRTSEVSRPHQENRPVYARANGFRR